MADIKDIVDYLIANGCDPGAAASGIMQAIVAGKEAGFYIDDSAERRREVDRDRKREERAAAKRAAEEAALSLNNPLDVRGYPQTSTESVDTSDTKGFPLSPIPLLSPTPPNNPLTPNPLSKISFGPLDFGDWPQDFREKFWSCWPHKVGKPVAMRALEASRKRGASFVAVIGGVERYKRNKPPDRPWLNPSTFLNQDRFNDQPAEVSNGKSESLASVAKRQSESGIRFGPRPTGIRLGPSGDDVRLLSQAGRERP